MKSALSYSASLLLAAGLSSALPASLNQNQVTISIASGDGDSGSTLQAGIGFTTVTQSFNAKSVKSSLFQSGVFCGGFKDAGATNLWLNFDGTDAIFSSGIDARYSSKSDGGVNSDPADAVTVASYWCSDSLAGVQNRIQQRTLPPREAHNSGSTTTTTTTSSPPPSSTTGSASNAASNTKNVVVNISVETERQTTFFGEQILANGQVQSIQHNDAISITIQTVDGANASAVQCQVIKDGKVLSSLTALDPAVLSSSAKTAKFDGIKCSV